MLGKNSADVILIFFSYFSQKIGFGISCKLFAWSVKAYFSEKKKKKKKKKERKIASVRQNLYTRICATSEDSDQPAHPRSLIRVFVNRTCLQWHPGYIVGFVVLSGKDYSWHMMRINQISLEDFTINPKIVCLVCDHSYRVSNLCFSKNK